MATPKVQISVSCEVPPQLMLEQRRFMGCCRCPGAASGTCTGAWENNFSRNWSWSSVTAPSVKSCGSQSFPCKPLESFDVGEGRVSLINDSELLILPFCVNLGGGGWREGKRKSYKNFRFLGYWTRRRLVLLLFGLANKSRNIQKIAIPSLPEVLFVVS